MRLRSLVATACLVAAVLSGGSAGAQYLLSPTPGAAGAQLQIGYDVPQPASAGVFRGGRTSVNGGTMGGGPVPDGPGPAYWPPLLIRRNPASMGSILQGLSTPQGGAITVPPAVLTNQVGSVPRAPIGVFPNSIILLQVRTTIDYAWPDAAAVFAPGGGPGIPGTPVILTGPGGGTITYNAGTKAFGGSAEFAVAPGPFAGTLAVPPGGTMGSKAPVLSAWFNFEKKLPGSVVRGLLLGASNPAGVAAPGRAVSAPNLTTMFGTVPLAIRRIWPPTPTPSGLILVSVPSMSAPGVVNPLTASKGFPWTTGLITVSAVGGVIPQLFFLSGQDTRIAGVGNVSMVSGALSQRKLTGPNANRGWVTLTIPQPAGALGAAVALGVLALCHALMRRRSA